MNTNANQNTGFEEHLREYEAILYNLPDNVFLLTEDGDCLRVYEGDEQVSGFDYQKLVGQNVAAAFPEHLAATVITHTQQAITQGSCQIITYTLKPCEFFVYSDNSAESNIELFFEARIKVLPLKYQGKKVVMWIARNITKRIKLEQEVRNLADKDDLTGLYNRRVFMTRLAAEFSEFKRYYVNSSMLMIDIDDFKKINDRLGHLSGDKVIRHVSERCRSSLRASDLLARIGGEEFAIFLPQTSEDQAWELAERLRNTIERQPCAVDDFNLSTSVSIGISSFDISDESHSDLLRRSDKAMYQSKKAGKNRATISPDSCFKTA